MPGQTSSPLPLPNRSALLAVVAANILLAFGPWFVRLTDVGPVASAFWRLALAVPFLFAILMVAGGGLPRAIPRGIWIVLLAAGTFFAADLASWHAGILHTKLANATLLGNSAIFLFPVYGFLAARAWPDRWQATALALAAVGTLLLLGRSYELSATNLLGDLLSLLAGVFYTVYFILMMRARGTLGPVPALLLSTCAGVPALAIAVPLMGETFLGDMWWPLVALALCSQVVGQGLMIYAIGHLTPLVMGLALLIQPVVGITIGWFAYGEALTLLDLTGAALVAVALVLVRRETRGETPAQLEPAVTSEDKAA